MKPVLLCPDAISISLLCSCSLVHVFLIDAEVWTFDYRFEMVILSNGHKESFCSASEPRRRGMSTGRVSRATSPDEFAECVAMHAAHFSSLYRRKTKINKKRHYYDPETFPTARASWCVLSILQIPWIRMARSGN
ncbi:hypothetical protein CEXT_642701 [Caerostris extrusa]|uniref:Secreted protein n=1 Tax=Caerostris extrusa TaxID=172846 RepID=A0AAV4RGD1_CAEEX|nr:hypothetical protein CEXT_642701 [Caerostris extrusa]